MDGGMYYTVLTINILKNKWKQALRNKSLIDFLNLS